MLLPQLLPQLPHAAAAPTAATAAAHPAAIAAHYGEKDMLIAGPREEWRTNNFQQKY